MSSPAHFDPPHPADWLEPGRLGTLAAVTFGTAVLVTALVVGDLIPVELVLVLPLVAAAGTIFAVTRRDFRRWSAQSRAEAGTGSFAGRVADDPAPGTSPATGPARRDEALLAHADLLHVVAEDVASLAGATRQAPLFEGPRSRRHSVGASGSFAALTYRSLREHGLASGSTDLRERYDTTPTEELSAFLEGLGVDELDALRRFESGRLVTERARLDMIERAVRGLRSA